MRDLNGDSALHYADGNEKLCRLLTIHGAQTDMINNDGIPAGGEFTMVMVQKSPKNGQKNYRISNPVKFPKKKKLKKKKNEKQQHLKRSRIS